MSDVVSIMMNIFTGNNITQAFLIVLSIISVTTGFALGLYLFKRYNRQFFPKYPGYYPKHH